MISHYINIRVFLFVAAVLIYSAPCFSKGDLSQQLAIDVKVNLSNKNGELKFFPNSIKFETGKLYKLILKNAGVEKHYFSSDKFAQSIYTRKLQVVNLEGRTTVEVKGHIREIEIYPGDTAEWWFVPIKTGVLKDLKCVIPGHAEAGMVGSIDLF